MGLLDRFRKFDRPMPPEWVTLEAIGWVRNDVGKPRPHGWEDIESRIELLPEHAERLRGIEDYSHVIAVFYMDLAADAPEKPSTLPVEGVETGILATRSQLAPEPPRRGRGARARCRGHGAARPRAGRDRRDAGARPEAVPAPLRLAPRRHGPGGVTPARSPVDHTGPLACRA